MSVDALIQVIAYGVPALLIVIGAFFYLAGYSINAFTQNSSIMNTGTVMIILGIIFYVLELIAKIAGAYYSYEK